jgi:hypothetical protein
MLSEILRNKQDRATLLLSQLMANRMDAFVAARLCIQPTGAPKLYLTQHSPAGNFISASSHHILSDCVYAAHYKDLRRNAKSDLLSKALND